MSMLPIVSFGKFKNKPITELLADRNYCDWLQQQPWFKLSNVVSKKTTSIPDTHQCMEQQLVLTRARLQWMEQEICDFLGKLRQALIVQSNVFPEDRERIQTHCGKLTNLMMRCMQSSSNMELLREAAVILEDARITLQDW